MRILFGVLLVLASVPARAADGFLRVGGGWDRSTSAVLRDRDCASTSPPALFGCGFEARGSFDETTPWELGAGIELSRGRVEIAFAHRDLEWAGESNFTGVTGSQHVSAKGRSQSALLITSFDVTGRIFVTAGAGVARNEVGGSTFSFPGLAPEAITIIPGGRHTGFAWLAGVGTTVPLTSSLHLDVSLRYQDSGELRSEAGPATIVRPRGTLTLEIDETRTAMKSLGAMVSLRLRL